ncbi:MAG TPA: pyridoxal phosphate-dependent aminotransferase [Planctomycetota bacterium]|jgi:aspartate/methionine/tyrosine aminotransferase
MAESKTTREPVLKGALPRRVEPNPAPKWNPWKEARSRVAQSSGIAAEPQPIAISAQSGRIALHGVVRKPEPRAKSGWNPWAEKLPEGVKPPEGYPAAPTPPVAATVPAVAEPAPIRITNAPPLAKRMNRLGTESAFDVLARVNKLRAEGKSVLSFALGEPDFDTPLHVRAAAKQALDEGQTHYCPSTGIAPLRKAIADYISRSRRITVTPEQVVVGPGGKPIIFDAMMALVNDGDEVIYPNPGYPIYESLADWLGAKSVPLPLLESKAFRLEVSDLEKIITPKTKLLVLNSPANPTGGVLTAEDMAGVAELACKHNFWVIADEIYSEILYIPQFASILQQPGMAERTVLCDGFSKTFAMTGWRLGYGVMPPELAVHMARIETNIDSCTNTFAQIAAVQAMEGPWDEPRRFRAEFQARRDAIVDGLNSIKGIKCLRPDGAFYVFPNVTEACKNLGLKDSREFQDKALVEGGVAVLARTCFGRKNVGEDQEYIRLSYATSMENILEGLRRLKAFCER